VSEIRSAKNELVREAAALKDPRRRRKAGRVLVEGPKSIADALAAGARFTHAFVREGEGALARPLERAKVPVHTVSAEVLAALEATEAAQGLVAVAEEPRWEAAAVLDAPGDAPLVVLDRVQDPGNVGAILRTAAALGFRGAALTAGTADPFAPKVVRAGAGTVFRLPTFAWPEGPLPARYTLVAAAAPGEPAETAFARAAGPAALVMGNEGQGVSEALLARCASRAWIPLAREVESLNVAAAFAILAWEATRPLRAPPSR